jgi:hypothetical protein|tara:strand:+ start:56 stop:409 length:354 start_codon:yes stop_codon:yes gene_type:complete
MEIQAEALALILQTQGWDLRQDNYTGNFIPDFYEDGIIIASCKKGIIVARGNTEFFLDGKKYNSIYTALEECGSGILNSINDWDWKEAKEWTVQGLNGKWITSFTSIANVPKNTRCR